LLSPLSKNVENLEKIIQTLAAFLVACKSSPVSQNPQSTQLTYYPEVAAVLEAAPQLLPSVFRSFHFSSLTVLRIHLVCVLTSVLFHL